MPAIKFYITLLLIIGVISRPGLRIDTLTLLYYTYSELDVHMSPISCRKYYSLIIVQQSHNLT